MTTSQNMERWWTSTRDAPPSHFIFKIESFSTLASSSLEEYKSCAFEASNCKWKLVVYPNGNKSKGGEDHISLYLASVNARSKVAMVVFRLFVFDNIRDKYFYAQDIIQNHAMKDEIGFDKFLPVKTFVNPSNGYLVNDYCMFGAEVFLVNEVKGETKGQCLSMIPMKPAPCKYTWKVHKFSKLEDTAHYSKTFTTRGHDWKMLLYPKGNNSERGKSLSLYLHLADSKTLLPEGRDVVVEMKLRIVDQLKGNHEEKESISSLNSANLDWGWSSFIDLKDLSESMGYLVNDTCIIEAEVAVLGSSKMWDCECEGASV